MDREELRHHIDSAAPGASASRLASLILHACWPGGPADRSERVALEWLRQWHPDHAAAQLPRCSCSTGHCILCN
ncbi:MAG TPA: hypothetical protein VEF89_08760 [Solirubrobacteraceae bacterium]|nr:hypothetical protein [Solirubrobacteraceae bacterium]